MLPRNEEAAFVSAIVLSRGNCRMQMAENFNPRTSATTTFISLRLSLKNSGKAMRVRERETQNRKEWNENKSLYDVDSNNIFVF